MKFPQATYLKAILNKIRDFYFKNATSDHDRLVQRLILDGDIYTIYFLEKWLEKHVAKSSKNTFLHR